MDINREIAEKVMGWKLFESKRSIALNEWCAPNKKTKGITGTFARMVEDFTPSTKINHAMEVEAEMFRRGYESLINHFYNQKGGEWFHISYDGPNGERGENTNKSLPEAICLAALEALK